MTKLFTSAALAALALAAAFACACSGGQEGASQPSEAAKTAAPVPTPTPEPTVVPDLLTLGIGGLLEDGYVKLYIPEQLEYDSSPAYNCAYYTHVSEAGESLVFAYLPDEDTSYAKEIGGLKRDDYAKQVYSSSGASLEEFKFTTVAGHEALRTLTVYSNDSGASARTLTYFIDIDGWLMTLSYTTNMHELPPECEQGILDIVIKADNA